MTSSTGSPLSSPGWGATVPPPRRFRSAVAGAGLVATFLLAWTFLALAVAGPAAHLGGGGAPPAAPAVERLARAGE